MPYHVEIKKPALKELRKFNKKIVREILKQIDKLEEHPDKYGKPLGGRLSGIWQLRSGKYRIWYTIEGYMVYVRAIKHKKKAEGNY